MSLVLAVVFATHVGEGLIKELFECESVAKKRCFIEHVHNFLYDQKSSCPIFTGIADMDKDGVSCRCSGSTTECLIPCGEDGPLIIFIGWSCKNLSKLNNGHEGMSRAEYIRHVIQHGTGTSGGTLHSTFRYAKKHKVPFGKMLMI